VGSSTIRGTAAGGLTPGSMLHSIPGIMPLGGVEQVLAHTPTLSRNTGRQLQPLSLNCITEVALRLPPPR
ncbi:MAG TPA: hypothetical protein VGH38_20790, partial [Bryobacteraceae bacterium]